ncbi:MAG TPA: iron ABC transporter permease [Candidatus Limnocylindria bacterium]|nr:iron ABC transporter permease [Candidatus Limnocylindria bacterium]
MSRAARLAAWSPPDWSTPGFGRSWRALFVILFVILLLLVAVPLGGLLISSVSRSGTLSRFAFTLGTYQEVLSDARTFGLLGTSIAFAAASAVIALLVGAPIAWFVERSDLGRKDLIRAVIFAQVAVPPLVLAMGWVLLASPKIGMLNAALGATVGPGVVLNVYSFPAMVAIQGLSLVPLVFVMLSPALRNMDASYEEAALATRGTGLIRAIWHVSLPLVRPALLAVALYAFIASLLSFDIPAVIGIPANVFVFSSEIFFSIQRYAVPRYAYASVLSMVTLVVVLATGLAYLRALGNARQFATLTGKYRARTLHLGRGANAIGRAWLIGYLLLGLVLPVAMVVWTSFIPFFAQLGGDALGRLTLQNYADVFATPRGALALQNTALNSVVAATVVTALAGLVAWVVIRSPLRGRRTLDVLALLPLVVPGVILGLSLQYAAIAMTFLPLYGTIWVLTLGHVTLGLPFATRNANSAISQIHPELEEAAQASGRSPLDVFRTITLPLIAPTLVFVWLWTLVHSIRDLSTSVLLAPPANPVLASLLWQLWDYGSLTVGAAVGTLLMAAVFLIALAALRILGRSRAATGLL